MPMHELKDFKERMVRSTCNDHHIKVGDSKREEITLTPPPGHVFVAKRLTFKDFEEVHRFLYSFDVSPAPKNS